MKYRPLGKTGIQVSELGHGTWAMGSMWGSRDDSAALAALRLGIERGINFIDTALGYGKGHSERLIGRILKETSKKIFVATKCPPKANLWPPPPGTKVEEIFPADHIIQTTEESLKNLGVDCLDLQQFHTWRDEWLGQGDWEETLTRLREQGKIRFFGVSLIDHQPDTGLKIVERGLVDTVQVIFNLFDQTPRERLFPLCLEKNVGVIARVPLDEGGLTGKLAPETKFPKGDWRVEYFKGGRLKETIEHAARFQFLIKNPVQTLPQAALKFCLSEGAVSTVIAGMRSTTHVEENVAAPDFSEISTEDLKRIYSLAWPRNYYSP